MAIRQLDWDAYCGRTIRIYRNLNNGTMSVQAKEGKSWKVVGHVTEAIVSGVVFKIQEGGRQRVIRDQCKNVHAWGEGVLLSRVDESILAPIPLGYNPYTDSTFLQRGTQHPIHTCKYLVVRNNLVFVSPDAVTFGADMGSKKVTRLELPNVVQFVQWSFAA